MKKKILLFVLLTTILLAVTFILSSCGDDTLYSVTFIADEKLIGTCTYTVDNKNIFVPAVPEKEHYTGVWENYTLDGGNKTVNAIYTPIEYTVTFIADGVTVDTKTYTVENTDIDVPDVPYKAVEYGYYKKNEQDRWADYTLDGGNKTVLAIYTRQTQARYTLVDNSYYSISGCNALFDGTLELLSEYNGKPVTSIGDFAFYGCTSLTNVTIGNSVTSIGDSAFRYCTSLTSVTIPNSVTSIGGGAFFSCDGLISVTIPNSVTSIGDSAFQYCTNLTSVTIGNGVTSIGRDAFAFCTSLTSVTIGNGVKSISANTFAGCSSLTSVTIPNSVTSIGEGAFAGCFGLTIYCRVAQKPVGWNSMWDLGIEKIVWGYTGA